MEFSGGYFYWAGRGCFGCWECVVAKPAEQTNLLAARVVELMHDAGVPRAFLSLLLGSGRKLGKRWLNIRRCLL